MSASRHVGHTEDRTATRFLSRRLAVVAALAMVSFAMLMGYWRIQQDDSYIFYSYAQNLAAGHGYVFNPGERINATTSPLYTLILSFIYLILRPLPLVSLPLLGHLIGAVALLVIALLLMKSFGSGDDDSYPLLLPMVFLLNPLLPNAIGMDTFLAMMFAMLCVYAFSRERRLAASLACSLAVLARPDMMLFAGVVLGYDVARNRRLPTVRMISAFLVPILAWMLFSSMYFGTFLPSTLAAKLGQTESARWGTGPIFFKGLVSRSVWRTHALMGLVFALALTGLIIGALRFRRWDAFRKPAVHLILLWSLVYLAVYGFILNPPAYGWYYTPLALGITILVAIPIEGLIRFLSHRGAGGRRVGETAAYLVLLLAGIILPLKAFPGPAAAKHENYRLAAEWLEANAAPGSTVGANEVGILRYYYRKGSVIDGLGLVTPEVADHVRRKDYDWYVHRYRPDYLMFNYPHRKILESMVDSDWFHEDYALRTILRTSRRAVAIYERQQ